MEQEKQYDHFRGIEKSSRAAYLIAGYITRNLTIAEEDELDNWLGEKDNMDLFFDITDEEKPYARQYLDWYDHVDAENGLSRAKGKLGLTGKGRVVYTWQYVAAACVAGLMIAGGIYFYRHKTEAQPIAKTPVAHDLQAGTSYARLKTGGYTIALTPGLDTVINGGTIVRNGEVITTAKGSNNGLHELNIPRKGYFKLVLPDGTRVFLNAESSIQYPSVFGNIREVSVTGETYFEIAKDLKHPFIVNVNGVKIEALGTVFNINAYNNEEQMITTLVEGVIRVSNASQSTTLRPAEKILIRSDKWDTITHVDTAPITAWTRNEFKLKNAPLREVMRIIERWYDAKVIYKTTGNIHFNGTISRDVPVSHLLKLLQETGDVNFSIDGNKIIVSN